MLESDKIRKRIADHNEKLKSLDNEIKQIDEQSAAAVNDDKFDLSEKLENQNQSKRILRARILANVQQLETDLINSLKNETIATIEKTAAEKSAKVDQHSKKLQKILTDFVKQFNTIAALDGVNIGFSTSATGTGSAIDIIGDLITQAASWTDKQRGSFGNRRGKAIQETEVIDSINSFVIANNYLIETEKKEQLAKVI